MDFEDIYLENSYLLRRQRKKKRRRYWVSEILSKRNRLGEFHDLFEDLQRDPAKFFNYYRMSQPTFDYILNAICPSVLKWSNFRETISPEEGLTVSLRYLATGCSFRTLGYSFRISDVTVGRIVRETCEAIWDNFQTLHMCFPKNEEINSITQRFWDKWKFPNCVGCIDGKIYEYKTLNIQVACTEAITINNIQAVIGPDYRFIAIDVGAYGKESDGGIFSNSNLSSKLEVGALGVQKLAKLPGTDIRMLHVLLGDEAYPLKPYLMRPFPVTKLGPSETIFNERLSKARQVIECAFGIITNKWRLLQKTIDVNPDFADKIVKCICLLHNIIIDREGDQELLLMSYQANKSDNRFASIGENRVTSACIIREKFKTYFCKEVGN